MKKVLSMLLALVMVMSLSVGTMAFAVGTSPKKAANREGTYKVEVIDHNTRYPTDVVEYKPIGVTPKVGVVFYAGNPVDYRDYGTLLKRVASAGYLVISPEFPLDTAILNWAAGEEYMKHYPEVEEWFFMGHSHGGGTAVWEATLKPELFKGLILISAVSFPCHLPDGYPVLSIHATQDMAVPRYQFEMLNATMYNCDVTEVIIQGANHAQFGDYGIQANDGKAKISKQKQLNIAMKHILKFMNKYQ